MEEPSLTTSRRILAGATAAAVILGGAGFLVGRATSPGNETAQPAGTETSVPLPIPTWSGPLARPDVLALAALAADTTAAGMAPDDELVQSDGRRFEIRLPFGCTGAAAPDADSGWTYNEANGTLRVFVTPERWGSEDWPMPAARTDTVESIEGFWIERPWTSSEACPARPAEPEMANAETDQEVAGETEIEDEPETTEAVSEPQALPTLAVGQIYTTESPRSGLREGQAFRAVVRVPAGDLDTSQGFRLRISGRLTRAGGPAPTICRQASPSRRPVCLVTVAMDEVSIENPATGETLATWTLGQRASSGTN